MVCRRLERTSSSFSARMSFRLDPTGRYPRRPHLASRASASILACSSPVLRRAWRSLDCFLRFLRMVSAFQTSVLFLRPKARTIDLGFDPLALPGVGGRVVCLP